MADISALVDVDWYFGLPYALPINETRIANVVAFAEKTLGGHLIAFQLGELQPAFKRLRIKHT